MGNLAVLTGASSGIGRQFALKLAKRGYDLLLVARRVDRLEELRSEIDGQDVSVDIFPADLSKRQEITKLIEHIESSGQVVDIFINCAGFGLAGSFMETDLDREISMIDVNVTAVHILTKEILRIMDKSGKHDKYIMNVASSAGLFPAGPYMATYYATKAYVTSLTRAISMELSEKHSDIYISCLCPGPVDTEFNEVADVSFALSGISADYCAEYALNKMFSKKTVIVPTLTMKFAIFGVRLLSGKAIIKMAGNQQKKKIYRK